MRDRCAHEMQGVSTLRVRLCVCLMGGFSTEARIQPDSDSVIMHFICNVVSGEGFSTDMPLSLVNPKCQQLLLWLTFSVLLWPIDGDINNNLLQETSSLKRSIIVTCNTRKALQETLAKPMPCLAMLIKVKNRSTM